MNFPREYLAALQEAQKRLNRKDGEGAIHIGAQLLRVMPRHPGVHVLLGRAFALEGNTDQSLARFRKATELLPKDPRVWTEFVTALLNSGQKSRARKAAQKAPLVGLEKKKLLDLAKGGSAPSSGPSAGGASLKDIRRIQTLLQKSRPKEASRLVKELLKTHPESAALLNLAGVAALELEDFKAAEEHFLRTLEISPRFVGAAVNLSLARVGQRDFKGAIASLIDALKLDPGSVDARKNLVLASADAQDPALTIEQAGIFAQKHGDDVDVLKAFATALVEVRQFEKAFEAIDRLENVSGPTGESRQMRLATLIEADRTDEAQAFADRHLESHPELRMEVARLRAQFGDFETARSDLRLLIDERPDEIAAYASYGTYSKWSKSDPMLDKLKAALGRVKSGSKEEASAYFALSKAQFDLNQDELAFDSLHRANSGQRYSYDFAIEERRRLMIAERWTKDAIKNLASMSDNSLAPIFIIGTPRSGSTLVENVIAAHPSVSSVGEDSIVAPFFPVEIAAEREAIFEAAKKSVSACQELVRLEERLLDKMLHNFMRVGALASAFPKARFVHTSREPRAVALSIYRNQFNISHAYSARLEDIARFFISYLGYMQHWERVVGERIITCHYETVVANPEREIRTLIEKLDLDWHDECLRPESVQKRVKTLSIAQVRSGINTASSELWKRYETHLTPFTEIVSAVWDFQGGHPKNRS